MQIEAAGLEQKNFSVYIFSSVRYINRNLQPAQPLLPQRSESSALGSKVRFTSELTHSLSLSLILFFSFYFEGCGKSWAPSPGSSKHKPAAATDAGPAAPPGSAVEEPAAAWPLLFPAGCLGMGSALAGCCPWGLAIGCL